MQIICPHCMERAASGAHRCPGCQSTLVDLALRLEANLPRDEWGRFHDVRLLDRIPGATVYHARDRREDCIVRIRVHDPGPRSRGEIEAWSRLYASAWDWQSPRLATREWRVDDRNAFAVLEAPPGPPLATWLSDQEFIAFPVFARLARDAVMAFRDLETDGWLHGHIHTDSFFHEPVRGGLVLDLPVLAGSSHDPHAAEKERRSLADFLYFLLTGCDPRLGTNGAKEVVLLWPGDLIQPDLPAGPVPIRDAVGNHPSAAVLTAIDAMLTPFFRGGSASTTADLLRAIERLGLHETLPDSISPMIPQAAAPPRPSTDISPPPTHRRRISLRPVRDRRGKPSIVDPALIFERIFLAMTPPPRKDDRGHLLFTGSKPWEPLLALTQAVLEVITLAVLMFGRRLPGFSELIISLMLLLLATVPLRFLHQRIPPPVTYCDPRKRKFFRPESRLPAAPLIHAGDFQDIVGTGVAGTLGFHGGHPGWCYRIELLFRDGRRLTVSPVIPDAVWTLDETASALADQLGVPHLPSRPERFLRVQKTGGQVHFSHSGVTVSLLAGLVALGVDGARRMLREDVVQWFLLAAVTLMLATLGIRGL